ncbi:MAG TPA: tetratricopeptide repeat protein [Polyangia bacterium]|nr:tetratricopeptide repeat protein [Polyangia bacterium]
MSATGDSLVIVHLESPNRGRQGDHIYRTLQPCRALGELPNVSVLSGSLLTPELSTTGLLLDADILILCDVVDADFLPVIEARRRRRKLTGYEINDHFLAPQPWNPTAYLAVNLISRSLSSQLARQADFVQFTVAELQRRFGELNPRLAVFGNHLWEMPAERPAPAGDASADDGAVTVGWGGSLGHRDDLRWMVPALQSFFGRHPRATLAIMGDPSFRELFAWLPAERFSFTPGGSIDAYYDFLRGLDVGLAPLLPTAFNRCRSDVKYLEYAAHGVLAIAADLEPYRQTIAPGDNGLLFGDLPQLQAALDWAASHPTERRAMATRARQRVAATRLERPHAADRLGFYLSVASQLGYPAPGRSEKAAGTTARSATPRPLPEGSWTFPDAHYRAAGDGAVERLLYDGLRHQQSGRPAEARRCFAEARRAAPAFYVPWLFLGGVQSEPAVALATLREALRRNPQSCNAAYLIGNALHAAGAVDEATQMFQQCRALAPSFGAAQVRLGELAEAAGRLPEAVAHYQEAALQNSSFALPVARLALLALGAGQPDKAIGLLEQHLKSDPELWLTNFLIGRGYLEQKKFHTARAHLLHALAAGADDRPAVLAQLARAEIGLGNVDAARAALDELKRAAARTGPSRP